jgi:hypothetical protein
MATSTLQQDLSIEQQLSQMAASLGLTTFTIGNYGEMLRQLNAALTSFVPPGSTLAVAPSLTVAETIPRAVGAQSVTISTVSGTIYMVGVYIPINTVINNFNVVTGSTASSNDVTINWAALTNASRVMLAASANATAQLTPAGFVNTLPVATTAAGAATSFTTTYSGLYYIAYTVGVTTTQPTLTGVTAAGTELTKIVPILMGTSSTAATATVPTFPTTFGAITATASIIYSYLN